MVDARFVFVREASTCSVTLRMPLRFPTLVVLTTRYVDILKVGANTGLEIIDASGK